MRLLKYSLIADFQSWVSVPRYVHTPCLPHTASFSFKGVGALHGTVIFKKSLNITGLTEYYLHKKIIKKNFFVNSFEKFHIPFITIFPSPFNSYYTPLSMLTIVKETNLIYQGSIE